MESEEAYGDVLIPSQSQLDPVDPKRARFPCSIVWTPLPLITWFMPFVGHIGICREDGVILDFAGPNFVSVDNFAFGAVTRYIQINREQCSKLSELNRIMTWDEALKKSTQEFQHRSYSLFTCNCHSFVANNLNRLLYGGHDGWNVVNIAALIFLKGTWVSKGSFLKTYLPFGVIFSIGLLLGGLNFLVAVAVLASALVGWFLVGTYCLKSLIEL